MNDVTDERKQEVQAAFDNLIEHVDRSELQRQFPATFQAESDWCVWVEEVTGVFLEMPEHEILHNRLHQYLRQQTERTLRPS